MPAEESKADDGQSPPLPDPEPIPDISDAAWAHNRWPTVGLYCGAGIGLLLAVVFYQAWYWAVLYVVAGAVAGCLFGFAAAFLTYGSVRRM